MASVSSLLKSASTIRNQLASYDDKVQAYQFQNSLRTDNDLAAYRDYLNGRINALESSGSISNISSALSMRQTLTTAINSTASANIQRSTIAVLDGQGSPDDKLAAIGNAFQQLYSVGDLSAAQSYESQYYSYYQTVQLQKAQAAAALSGGGGGSSSSSYTTIVSNAVSAIQGNIHSANAAFAAQGPKFLDQQTNSYLKEQAKATGSNFKDGSATIFAALAGQVGMVNQGIQLNGTTKYEQGTYTPGSILDVYTQAMTLDPSNASKYQGYIDGYLNGATGIALPGEGNKSLTYNALMNTVYAGNSGNAPYGLQRGADGSWQVQAEHVNGYTFGKDMNGNVKLMPSYSFFNTPLNAIKVNGGTLADAVKKAGLNAKQDYNGDWWFQATNQSSFLAKELGNYSVQGAVQKNGTVQFMTADGRLLQMVHDSSGKMGLQQVNQFGQVVNANVAGQYGFNPKAVNEQGTPVVKGSTQFMGKVLGDTAVPQQITTASGATKTVYSANGKLYQLATDSKGLKGLQEIDKTGKVINNNVAGQYGFNPSSVNKSSSKDVLNSSIAGQFSTTLLNQHNQYLNELSGSKNKSFGGAVSPDALHIGNSGYLGVSSLLDNARIMQTINQAHDQAMIELAKPAPLPTINLPAPAAPSPAPQQAPSVSTLRVAPTYIQGQNSGTQSVQPASGGFQSGNTQGINNSGGSGIRITGTTNAAVGMRI